MVFSVREIGKQLIDKLYTLSFFTNVYFVWNMYFTSTCLKGSLHCMYQLHVSVLGYQFQV